MFITYFMHRVIFAELFWINLVTIKRVVYYEGEWYNMVKEMIRNEIS